MKKIIIILAVLCLAFVSCSEEKSKPAQSKQAVQQQQKNKNQQSENQKTASQDKKQPTWPFIGEAQKDDKVLADDLLAKNYMLIFDGSGSMSERKCADGKRKIDVAKEAVSEWSKSVPKDANLGLVAFHNNGWKTQKLQSGERHIFNNAISQINAGGKTPLSGAFKYAYDSLTLKGRTQLGYGEYTLVVVTDGIANDPKLLSQWVDYILVNSPINIYTIGFCIGANHSLNQPDKIMYKAANNPTELRQGLKEVLAEAESFDEADFSN